VICNTPFKMEDTFYISTDKSKLDVEIIFDYLSNRSYWAKGRSIETIEKSIENSLCFGVYDNTNNQVGFARVVSDRAVFAWLMDVFILPSFQGKGLGKLLMASIMSCKDLQEVKKWGLGTKDAHGLYRKFGFTTVSKPENMMELEMIKSQ
jgi:GNAT superfamily N-acetyltransferase